MKELYFDNILLVAFVGVVIISMLYVIANFTISTNFLVNCNLCLKYNWTGIMAGGVQCAKMELLCFEHENTSIIDPIFPLILFVVGLAIIILGIFIKMEEPNEKEN